MITWSKLQQKEVIIVSSGERLGYIYDLHIDAERGFIVAIILLKRSKPFWTLQKSEEIYIEWSRILTIGKDVILVNQEKDLLIE